MTWQRIMSNNNLIRFKENPDLVSYRATFIYHTTAKCVSATNYASQMAQMPHTQITQCT